MAEQSRDRIVLSDKLAAFDEHWSPRIIAAFNDNYVKLVKVKGEFVWHHHDVEDEIFLVLRGRFLIRYRDRDVWLEEGELAVVPHGVEHMTYADDEASILMIEPKTTINTGTARTERTAPDHWL